MGAREHQDKADWGGYPVDATALRHGAGVERETNDVDEDYTHVPRRQPTAWRPGWLPAV